MLEKKFVRYLLCLVVALSFSATGALGDNILFISAMNPDQTIVDDALKAFMEGLGHTVTYFDDDEDEATTEAAAAAADLVYISESVGSSGIREEITEIETPMIVGEMWAWDEMGLTYGGGADENTVTADIEIVNPGHPLAAGLSGTVAVLTDITGVLGDCHLGKGIAGEEATVIATATLADGETYDIIFVYEKGAALPVAPTDGSPQFAADIRVCLGFHEWCDPLLNENAYALLEAAIKYILGVKTQARTPDPRDRSFYADTWATLSWSAGDFALSHDVYFGDNFDDVNAGAESTFQGNQVSPLLIVGFHGFAFPDGLVPGTTYYWRVDEINEQDPNSPWKGSVWSFSIPPRTAYNPEPADGAELVDPDVELNWTGGFGSKLHTVYFGENFDDVNNATGGLPQGIATYTPGPLKLAKTYYWRVDEFDVIDTYKGDVWSFTTQGGVGSPNPSNGAMDVERTPVLTWTPGVYAASHQLYFGTDKDAVRNADTSSPEYKGTGNLGSESYNPGKLQWCSTYYWRIDEVNDVNPDSPWTGSLWNFTTADFIVIDDFEDYNDYPPDEIFSTWIDGWEVPTNGSMAGHADPPFAETGNVHGGGQSMPLYYDNNFMYSEATTTLTQRNWTEEDVGELSLWFCGDAANAAERMYVALNGSAVVYHGNPNVAQIERWTEWTIDLQEFAAQGVNLYNVNTISIGFGDKNNLQAGGSGTVLFDDIRLYRPAEPEPEPAP